MSTYAGLVQQVSLAGSEWTREVTHDLILSQSEYFIESVSSTLSLSDAASGVRDIYSAVQDNLGLIISNTVAGGRVGGGTSTCGPFIYEIEDFTASAGQAVSQSVQMVGTIPLDTELVFLNGVQLHIGVGHDYTLSGSPTLVTFLSGILNQNDIVTIKYSPPCS